MDELVIRRATVEDVQTLAMLRRADAVERLNVAPEDDPGFEDRFVEWFRATDGFSVTWLAEDDAPVGMLQLFVHDRMPAPSRDTGGWGYVGLVFVLPDRRNAGVGRRLVDTAVGYANEHGFSRLLLHPTEDAVPLYRRAGFDPTNRYLLWSRTDVV